ncbi:hypothetical protein C9763_12155 [Listeria monocytogenes]|nr:hypothetical protein C9763_12155 [Listeria monocytogenes]
MWVLMKNGIVDVEATNAYNAAVLGGKMPHESNEAQEEAELLQAVVQSVQMCIRDSLHTVVKCGC